MTATQDTGEAPKPKSKLLPLAAVLALVLGGGAFYAVYAGIVVLPFGAPPEPTEAAAAPAGPEPLAPDRTVASKDRPGQAPAFIALDPLIVSLGPATAIRRLKLTVAIEVDAAAQAEVQARLPRVIDVLNTFLRAVDETQLTNPREMGRLRAQILRRVQLVSPPGAVRDVLVQEFVLN
ncbi:MAG: flagellar basal body-associated FliL family protein [Pseudomonadota bacterium]